MVLVGAFASDERTTFSAQAIRFEDYPEFIDHGTLFL